METTKIEARHSFARMARIGLLLWACFHLAGVLVQPVVAQGQDRDSFATSDREILEKVFPDAEAFGELAGDPSAIPAYREGQIVGYVLSSWMTVSSTGYSAKPIDVVVGLNLAGIITGAAIASHSEPILVIGITDRDLDAFVAQFAGLDIRQATKLGTPEEGGTGLDVVSGATISSLVINDAILRSARSVAASRGILGSAQSGLNFSDYEPATWRELLEEGSLGRLFVSVGRARGVIESLGGRLFPEGVPLPAADEPFFELFLGLGTPARIGRNLLGERTYGSLRAESAADDQFVFVGGHGLYSFKGRNYRRSGFFERLALVQGDLAFRFVLADHIAVEELVIEGAPPLREIALFKIPAERGFDPARPWRLQVLVQSQGDDSTPSHAVFELPYELPVRYFGKVQESAAAAEALPNLWRSNWQARKFDIAVLIVGLIILTTGFVFQDALTSNRRRHEFMRIAFPIFTFVWIGWIAGAQLSVLNVLTFFESLITGFKWEFFLIEPLIFILWAYVAIALLFWGRGVYCGWLCPFGAAQDLMNRIGLLLKLPQWRLPFGLHERLWPIKYIIFIALFAGFLFDPELAIKASEIEPFKTAIVMKFQREWPFVLFAAVLLIFALFVPRLYCRYLCPLGAALALPARIRMFEWLKRRWQCGTPCQICAVSCPVQAIHPEGKINPNECIHCLTCQVNYHDHGLCPPLLERRRRRERARGSKVPEPGEVRSRSIRSIDAGGS